MSARGPHALASRAPLDSQLYRAETWAALATFDNTRCVGRCCSSKAQAKSRSSVALDFLVHTGLHRSGTGADGFGDMGAFRYGWPFTHVPAQARRLLRAPPIPVAIVTLALSAFFGLAGAAASLVLWSLSFIRSMLGHDGRVEDDVFPEDLPPGVHWLIIDSPLSWAAVEHVCRAIGPQEFGTTSIVLDLRTLKTFQGLPGASPAELLRVAGNVASHVVALASTALVREFSLGQDQDPPNGYIHVQSVAAAVAKVRVWHSPVNP